MSRNQVGKDIELQNMRETEEKLRLEIIQKKEDIERFVNDYVYLYLWQYSFVQCTISICYKVIHTCMNVS